MNTVLVTGATGFIGRRLCRRLKAAGLEVRVLLRRPADGPWDRYALVELGRDAIPVEMLAGVQVVFHLAGKAHAVLESPDEEAGYQQVNVAGTRMLLEAAQAAGVRSFVLFSSVKAMGEGGEACLDETCDLLPETPYGRSKKQAEDLLLNGGYVPHPVVLRLAMVYGPGHKGNLARMIAAIAGHRFPPLPETGNRRSMVHVDDVGAAAMLVATRDEGAGKIYLVTDGREYSTRQIYEWICETLGLGASSWTVPLGLLRFLARLGDGVGRLLGRRFLFDSATLAKLTGSACYSAELISRELGFRPTRNLQESLPEIVRDME